MDRQKLEMECSGPGQCATKEQDEGNKSNITDELSSSIPLVTELFRIHRQVGEGTFSCVYMGTLKSSDSKKEFALKHLVPTCHPERIQRELDCLQRIGGQDNVVGLELCLRNLGSVVFVTPYMRHDKFTEYVHDMSVQETKDYMRALMVALKRVHKFNIIHRDIKPINFLYDRQNKRYATSRVGSSSNRLQQNSNYSKYLLVDFGLAQSNSVQPTKEITSLDRIQSSKRKRMDENTVNTSTTNIKKSMQDKCHCFGRGKICSLCLSRPSQSAPRAGTPGFRAPEVLLKSCSQTTAIDMWASGVILLCILSGTQSFFRSPDDCSALAEITSIFGSEKMQICARKLGKKLEVGDEVPGINITVLCQKLLKRNLNRLKNNPQDSKGPPIVQYPNEAYHLLTRLLDLDYKTRITAEAALNHPFLARI